MRRASSPLATSTPPPPPAEAAVALLQRARDRVDAVLERWGTQADGFWPAPLPAAVRYALLGAGKRLRPALVLASYDAAAGRGNDHGIEALAAAVEVVHAYSLVHDDLPCMDDDDLRRGRPTTHRAFDVPNATLAGYLMVPLAARVLAEGLSVLAVDAGRARRIAGELVRAAGAGGMIGGQALDLEAEGQRLPVDALTGVHARKTGALISAACVIGGLAAGASDAVAEALRGYGARIGLAFQIYDDVLDATGTSAQLGKTAGKDAQLAKATFVSVLGVDGARAEAARLSAQAVAQLSAAGISSSVLEDLARYIVSRPN
jgi:geranylgeranyl pyrophosphate synthase